MKYTCKTCGYQTNRKYNYNKHLHRKYPCKSVTPQPELKQSSVLDTSHSLPNSPISIDTTKLESVNESDKTELMIQEHNTDSLSYRCDCCGKEFEYRQSLSRHKKKCIKKPMEITNQGYWKLLYEQAEKDKDALHKQIETLLHKVGNRTIINNTFTINNYGDEDISHLTGDYFKKLIMAGPFGSIPSLVKKIHFDPQHPENMNIQIMSKKGKFGKVFHNNEWLLTDKKQMIDNLVEEKKNIIDKIYRTSIETKIPDYKKNIYTHYKQNIETPNSEEFQEIKRKTELVLVNETVVETSSK